MAIPQLIDRQLLCARYRRAIRAKNPDARFLIDRAIDDIEDRLAIVSRLFPVAWVINGFSSDIVGRLMQSGRADVVFAVEPVAEAIDDRINSAVVGDEEHLPIASESADLIVSPLTMQFVNDLPGALVQIRQALKPDGLFLGSMLGGNSLVELRHAFAEAEAEWRGGISPRFLPLADVRDLGGLLQRAGFALPVADRDILTVRYESALDLMGDLKAMGASNSLVDRDRTPVSRGLLAAVDDVYRSRFGDPDGRIRATFEIISLSGWAPHDSQQKPAARGSAQISLATYLERDQKS